VFDLVKDEVALMNNMISLIGEELYPILPDIIAPVMSIIPFLPHQLTPFLFDEIMFPILGSVLALPPLQVLQGVF